MQAGGVDSRRPPRPSFANMGAHSRESWRPFRERAAVRAIADALVVDEAGLRALVKPMLKQGDAAMRAQVMRGKPQNEALLQQSQAFNEQIGMHCMRAIKM